MNNTTKKSMIWDLDGTLIDSYPIITKSLHNALSNKGIPYSQQTILKYIKKTSVHHFITKIADDFNIPYNQLKSNYSAISKNEQSNIQLIPNAKEILEILVQQGISNFIYTHRGLSTIEVLKKHGIIDQFKEIITSDNGFKRKPDAEGIVYLINKYSLDRESAFYVGDRALDIECARNAGIKSILLVSENSHIPDKTDADYVIKDLIEINNI